MITDFRFLHPLLFAALALVPLLLWLRIRNGRKGMPTVLFSDGALLATARPTWRTRAWAMMPWMRGAVLCLGIVALARPQLGTIERNVRSLGVDIAISMDVSGSMQAMDIKPNRLEAAKVTAAEFVRNRPTDRISVVLYGVDAAVLCPPTFDHDAVAMFINSIHNEIIDGQGTAIGTGLALAVDRLKDSEAKSRVVILLSDGQNNSGKIDPLQAAEIAKALDVRVYTIGMGGDGPALIQQTDPFGRVRTVSRPDMEVDEVTLRRIADLTGGRYFRATSTEGLTRIYSEINQLEKTEIETEESADYDERFMLLWIPGLILLGMEFLLRGFVLRRVP